MNILFPPIAKISNYRHHLSANHPLGPRITFETRFNILEFVISIWRKEYFIVAWTRLENNFLPSLVLAKLSLGHFTGVGKRQKFCRGHMGLNPAALTPHSCSSYINRILSRIHLNQLINVITWVPFRRHVFGMVVFEMESPLSNHSSGILGWFLREWIFANTGSFESSW